MTRFLAPPFPQSATPGTVGRPVPFERGYRSVFTVKKAAAGLVLSGFVVGAVLVAPTAAEATPPSGVSAKVIATMTIGTKQYVLREITIAPGGSTGWHYHDGPVLARLTSGTLTHMDADCSVVTYRVGQTIVEPSGANHVHIGRNDTTAPLVLDALYILPVGAPFAEDAADAGCGR
jgi:quercetin dioxygenase-like cupin family protein